MRATRAKALLLLLALVAGFAATPFGARPAYACSCAGAATPEQALKGSDAVFAGEVVATGLPDPNPRDGIDLGGVRFAVERSWKGVSGDSAVVYGQGEGYFGPSEEGETVAESSCDVRFAKGVSYLVYAFREDGYPTTNVCSRTADLTEARKDLDALGPPSFPMPETGGTPVVVVAALLLLCGLIARRLFGG